MISVVTPYYKGEKYILEFLNKLDEQASKVISKYSVSVELIIVNDSPEEQIKIDDKLYNNIKIMIINNNSNVGIHQTRVNGLTQSSGEYIVFLDQDDFLINNALVDLYKSFLDNSEADIVVGNGIIELYNGKHKILDNEWSYTLAIKENSYLYIRDFIVSPGQCMIKKNSIPVDWIENILSINGTDDYLLWLLMFNNKCKFIMCKELVYVHTDTSNNLSSDETVMNNSLDNMIALLENTSSYSKRKIKLIKRRINYKRLRKGNFFKFFMLTILNLDILMINAYYRIRFKGALYK